MLHDRHHNFGGENTEKNELKLATIFFNHFKGGLYRDSWFYLFPNFVYLQKL